MWRTPPSPPRIGWHSPGAMMPDTLSKDRTIRLRDPRPVKLVVTALAVIAVSAASLFAVSLFPNALAALSGIVTDHPGYVRATNALAAGFCCIFLLWPRAGSRLVGRWNEYVGWAFFILFIQYIVRLAALFFGGRGSSPGGAGSFCGGEN